MDGFGLAGMYIDCVFISTADNFRREHFRFADEPLAFERLPVSGRNRLWTVRLQLPTTDTAVVRIASRHDLALDPLAPLADLLRQAQNYRDAIVGAGVMVTCPDYDAAQRAADAATRALRSGKPAPLPQVQAAGESMQPPTLSAPAADHAYWFLRLTQCTAAAQACLQAATDALG